MESIKKTQDIVKHILETQPATRNSDDLLYVRVCEYVHKNVSTLPFGLVIVSRKELKLPSFKSVERSRRKLQEYFPELAANATAEAFRELEEEKYKSYAKKVVV